MQLSQNGLLLKNGCRAKRVEIWSSWVLVENILGTFDLVVFKLILMSLGALLTKWPASPKQQAYERKLLKLDSGYLEHV